jgi:hypothetical protein
MTPYMPYQILRDFTAISVYNALQAVSNFACGIVKNSVDEYTLDYTRGYLWESSIPIRILRANVYDKLNEQ